MSCALAARQIGKAPHHATLPTIRQQSTRYGRGVRAQLGPLLAVIGVLHVIAWGTLLFVVLPHHYTVGTQVFGLGLGFTAYTLGLRHAFDADHIAAIDNTTRKLMADGQRPVSVGFWFALGHSTVVAALTALIAFGVRATHNLINSNSSTHETLGIVGTSLAGLFLYFIAALNLVALAGILRTWRRMRHGQFDANELEDLLDKHGVINRLLRGLIRSIRKPVQLFPIGLLFGLGFDTATEVALLVFAGTGAAGGLPWYVIAVVPLLFTAGMTLLDTLDGAVMTAAYRWAFAHPARKIYYNATITGLSVAVALLIGSVELVGVLHDHLGLDDPVTNWISGLDLNNLGFTIVGLFLAVWLIAVGYWRLAGLENRLPRVRAAAVHETEADYLTAGEPLP